MRGSQRRPGIAVAGLLASLGLSVTTVAQAKSFIDYIKPTPITCASLSSESWGVAGVLPRDLCNGIESAKGAAVPPEFYYWDGQILKAADGKYHMFMSTWSGTAGFNPGWTGSDAFHAISDQGVLGPYQRKDYVYTNNGSHKGHNVSALELPDGGGYAVVVSETVAFTIYKSSSLDGPWTGCVAQIQPNGIKTSSDVACPPGGACNDTHWDSNVSLIPRHDGRFEIVQRHGFIAIADTLCGPYKMQKPTWTYPQANLPNVDSIYPKRTSIPGVSNPTYGWEEDPHIWYSGGTYHVIYSGSGDRVGWHLYSTDGITEWKDDGLAYGPREYQKIFCYEGSTTCTEWYKCERPGVVLEGGHPTHITLAVADVDKDNQIPAGSNHGSKVIVLPFDGVSFDADYGNGEPGTGGGTGTGGATGTGGVGTGGVGTGGQGGATATTGGRSATGGSSASGGSGGTTSTLTGGTTSTVTGGSTSSGGTSSASGGTGVGGSTASSTGGSGGSVSPASGGVSTSGGTAASTGGSNVSSSGGSGVGGSTDEPVVEDESSSSGCGCILVSTSRGSVLVHSLLLGALGILAAQRRSRRDRRSR